MARASLRESLRGWMLVVSWPSLSESTAEAASSPRDMVAPAPATGESAPCTWFLACGAHGEWRQSHGGVDKLGGPDDSLAIE